MPVSIARPSVGASVLARPSVAVRAAILLLQVFRFARLALFPVQTCRFAPTCTEYAMEALRVHGILKGSGLAAKRVVRCHPFHPGGIDPVPPPDP